MKYQDYYEVLGVTRSASHDEIQRSYRKLARKYHPDVSKEKGAEEKFKQLNEAYEVLHDQEKRKRYDALGANWRNGQDFQPPPGAEQGFNFGSHGGPFGAGEHEASFSFEGSGFSDFFEALFGGSPGQGFDMNAFGRAAGPRAQAGGVHGDRSQGSAPSAQAEVALSVEDLYHCGKKALSLQSSPSERQSPTQQGVKSFNVKIPPGTTEGSTIRLAGQAPGGGDLLLKIKVAPHAQFRVEVHNLNTTLRISPWEAALGAKVAVPVVAGEVLVTIPAGSQTGARLRLKGKGLPLRGGEHGDLYVELLVAVPSHLTHKERELFSELQKVSNFNPRGAESAAH